jgi:hypothetical protein
LFTELCHRVETQLQLIIIIIIIIIVKGVCRKEGGSHILQCEGTRVWRVRWWERKFTSVHPKIGIKKIA